ncbi:MAG: prepilin-type N-terminal cleavage/methylation domain-containing protein [Elusimicrobiaceae bacterium]|nr:prepilin-type N-terminal cleavage/methylation domain-containing protein [Elusimicrobiaceae bacterium]
MFHACKRDSLGFTLIELLVVVLMLALLTVAGVVQYQRTSSKSRYVALFPIARALSASNEMYFLSHGHYADALAQLDVRGLDAYPTGATFQLHVTPKFSYLFSQQEGLNNNYIVYQNHSDQFPANIHCEAKKKDRTAAWLCQTLGGTKLKGSITQGYDTYILQGSEKDGTLTEAYVNESGITLTEGDTCETTQTGGCQNIVAEGATCNGNDKNGCAHSQFNEESTCNADAEAGCFKSKFKDSECHVYSAANSASTTSCGGSDKYSEDSYYDNSKCFNEIENTNGFGCGRSTYDNKSECFSNKYGGCGNSKYDHGSICHAEGTKLSCDYARFDNGSVCEANGPQGCVGTTYYNGSYCIGTHCPKGSPKNPAEGGGYW